MGYLAFWWVVIEALGILGLPLTFRLFSPANAHGYPFSKILTLLILTYISWMLAHTGILTFSVALPATVAAYALLAAWRAWTIRAELANWLRTGGLATMARHDLLWTAGFLFFAWQRALAPDIFGAEKYMDFAFLNTLVRTEHFPPEDPWMAGKTLNYYYFGYLMFANLVRASGIPSHIAYNLCVATVGGLGFGEFAAIGWRLTGRFFFAAVSGLCTMVLGNLDGAVQALERGSLTPMDYWRSSRVVAKGDTINEFPFFSTIHGDLHPHFMVLPVTGLLLAILLDRAMFPRRDDYRIDTFARLVPLALTGLVLGTMAAISTWELPVGVLLVFLLMNRDLPFWPPLSRHRLHIAAQVAGILILAYVFFIPFYINFVAPTSGGVGFRLARTSLREFLTVHGLLLFPLAVLAAVEVRRLLTGAPEWRHLALAAGGLLLAGAALAGNGVVPLLVLIGGTLLGLHYRTAEDQWRAPLTLATVALIALLACELVFLRDSYGEKLYRMNTVFKLYFQAWLLLSVTAPWALATILDAHWTWPHARRAVAGTAAVLAAAAAAYPAGLTATRLGSGWPLTLDGTAYLAREHPDDFAALKWLRENVKGLPVVLEASGDPYSYYARFSSNTGLPTVLGWANHEGLWRADHSIVDKLRREVAQMYNAPSLEQAAALLDEHRVAYILVGDLERKDFASPGLDKFAALKVAFQRGATVVYER